MGSSTELDPARGPRRPAGKPRPAWQGSASEPWPVTPTILRCERGHVLHGRVAKELWLRSYRADCGRCGCRIVPQDASYACEACRYSVCTPCASESRRGQLAAPVGTLLGRTAASSPGSKASLRDAVCAGTPPGPRPAAGVMAGDILLCGPDVWGVHHTVLSRGAMRPADPGIAERLVKHAPHLAGMDIFECDTIESSRPLKGNNFPWYPARSYFARPPTVDALLLVADIQDGTNTMGVNGQRVPVKLLLHPLRPEFGGPDFHQGRFREALDLCEMESKRWSKATAIRSMLNRQGALDPQDYPDSASRLRLLEELRRSRAMKPICSSVAINVWQRYFELGCGGGPEGDDLAARHILRWMPVLGDKTTPSAMLKVLTCCGWVLSASLEE